MTDFRRRQAPTPQTSGYTGQYFIGELAGELADPGDDVWGVAPTALMNVFTQFEDSASRADSGIQITVANRLPNHSAPAGTRYEAIWCGFEFLGYPLECV